MLCKQVPVDIDKYYVTTDMDLVYQLIEHDIHPMYQVGELYYFLKTGKFEKYMSIRRHKIFKEGGK